MREEAARRIKSMQSFLTSKKRRVTSLFILITLVLTGLTPLENTVSQPQILLNKQTSSIEDTKSWFNQTQVYNMVAFAPDDIKTFHVTVNGLWNGFFANNLSSPFALGRYLETLFSGRNYTSDKEFVDTMHEEGMLVPATILTTQGHHSFQGDKLEEFACRSVDGKLCYWDKNAESYWMNALNNEFIDWCIQHGKKAIDAGADLIVLDEIQGSGFIPMYQWASQYIDWLDAPGFSNCTIEKFREFLMNKYSDEQLQQIFDINNISSYDLKNRIAQTMYLTYDERIKADALNKEYFEFLEIGNFNAKKRLIQELKEYAAKKGKNIAIAANSYALGTPRGGDYWSKGLQFAGLLDFFTFENKYSALADNPLPGLPRAKWLAWEKLAYASTNTPGVILLGASEAAYIAENPLHSYKNYLSILCAEAYANRGAFVNWYMKVWGKNSDWEGCADIYDFVIKHQKLYKGVIKSPVAILYLYGEGMRNKSDSYLGLAQALAESNTPFEIVFDGDGFYINESLTLEKLTPYDLLFIPSVLNITENQKKSIKEYVMLGGKAVVFDPQALGFEQQEGELSFGNGTFIFTQDVANEYFHTYNDELRQRIQDIVEKNVPIPLYVEKMDRKIIAYPYFQPEEKRIVIHLVNYDYIKWNDKVVPKTNVHIRIKKPGFNISNAYVVSPCFNQNLTINLSVNEDYVDMVIPELKIYDVIVITSKTHNYLFTEIKKPKKGYLYIFDRETASTLFGNTIILGKITIEVNTTLPDLEKTEFYIDDKLKQIDTQPPYEWVWDETVFGRHKIMVIVYNSTGYTGGDEMDVIMFNI
ncbi:MAG: hypothetical protein J7L32_06015 [Thermoplasmata archaeon]|nr:hypothetical protein [Thermoplasmata archaeon]